MKFIRPLLDIVSDDGKADFVVSVSDNISNIFEEYGEILWLMFFFGIIAGIIIHGIIRFLLKKMFKKFFEDPDPKSDDQEGE